jgi:hypothetical protein
VGGGGDRSSECRGTHDVSEQKEDRRPRPTGGETLGGRTVVGDGVLVLDARRSPLADTVRRSGGGATSMLPRRCGCAYGESATLGSTAVPLEARAGLLVAEARRSRVVSPQVNDAESEFRRCRRCPPPAPPALPPHIADADRSVKRSVASSARDASALVSPPRSASGSVATCRNRNGDEGA